MDIVDKLARPAGKILGLIGDKFPGLAERAVNLMPEIKETYHPNDKLYQNLVPVPLPADNSREAMEKFYSEAKPRLLFVRQANVDLTDDWGTFGYQPAFYVLQDLRYTGTRCINDERFYDDSSMKDDARKSVLEAFDADQPWAIGAKLAVPIVNTHDDIPFWKFNFVRIMKDEKPVLFDFLAEKVSTPEVTAAPEKPRLALPAKTRQLM